MSIVAITPEFITAKLNSLPPSSRKRAGYIDIMRHIKRKELEAERELEAALMAGLAADPEYGSA